MAINAMPSRETRRAVSETLVTFGGGGEGGGEGGIQ